MTSYWPSLWTVQWSVSVDGQDITDRLRPHLLSISVSDKEGQESDSCQISIDDAGGQIRLPRKGAPLTVALQGAQVFSGFVDSCRSSGARGGGRTLSVSAKGFDPAGKAKEPQQLHQDEGTIGDFLQKLGEKAGFDVKVVPEIAKMVRPYLAADGESLLHTGQRLARELGGTFKLRGNEAVLVRRGLDLGLPGVTGTVSEAGGNVISWNISPFTTRPGFTKATVTYFDRESASFKEQNVEVDLGDKAANKTNSPSRLLIRSPAADKDQAKAMAEAQATDMARSGGEGTVVLDATPEAQAEGLFTLRGARPGVDGVYRIRSVTHQGSRGSGTTTSLDLGEPGEGAGEDTREE